MARLNLAPTKSTSLRLKRELSLAEEGFELLEEKRQILVLELMSHLARAQDIEEEVKKKMALAHKALREDILQSGAFQMRKETLATAREHIVQVAGRHLMGIEIPELSVQYVEPGPSFSFREGSSKSDEVMKRFSDALRSIERLAEIETTIFRLASEVRKTQRRVNALEKVFIPTYRETLSYISDSLEEREREGMLISKMIKARREERP